MTRAKHGPTFLPSVAMQLNSAGLGWALPLYRIPLLLLDHYMQKMDFIPLQTATDLLQTSLYCVYTWQGSLNWNKMWCDYFVSVVHLNRCEHCHLNLGVTNKAGQKLHEHKYKKTV